MIGALLRRLGLDTLTRQYAPVGLAPNELDVRVTLCDRRREIDVSESCSIASLRPLRLVLSSAEPEVDVPATLRWRERGNRLLGELVIDAEGSCGPDGRFRLYRVTAQRCMCLGPMLRGLTGLYWRGERLRKRWRGDSDPFLIDGLNLWATLIFYIRPRPVVVVTVGDEVAANTFPMDLTGTSSKGEFLLALRSTSSNIETIARTGRIALAEVPPELSREVYALAAYHKRVRDAGEAMPFPVALSPTWRLPLPATALRVREVEVRRTDVVGSHHLFTTGVVHDQNAPGRRLHHLSQIYMHDLRRLGRALTAT